MNKVYIVSSGEYSDWIIRGVFSTKEKAKDFKKLIGTPNDIDEYEVDERNFPEYKGKTFFHVYIEKEGRKTDVYTFENDYEDEFVNGEIQYKKKKGRFDYDKGKYVEDGSDVMRFSIVAKTETHAIKIANDILSQLLAYDLWGKVKNVKVIK